MRVGPSRLTSTAPSSGESNATVAAEWMTMSHDASAARPASSRPRPSVPTSPAIDLRPAGRSSRRSLGSAELGAQPVEGVVLEDLALDPLRPTVERRPGRTSRTISQSGTDRSSRSTSAVPRKPVVPVTTMRLPARASAITPTCLPFGK